MRCGVVKFVRACLCVRGVGACGVCVCVILIFVVRLQVVAIELDPRMIAELTKRVQGMPYQSHLQM